MDKSIHRAIYSILKPLVAILHRKSVAFDELSQITRKIYVEVAEEKLLAAGERPSNSRISVTTGLTRPDVAKLRKLSHSDLAFETHLNRAVKVTNGWMTDAEFMVNDSPAPLPLKGNSGSFEALVKRYSGDVPYKAMHKELSHNGIIDESKSGKVLLLAGAAYIPRKSEQQRLQLMGQDIAELIKTIDHNHQNEPDAALYQRKVCYDNLPSEAAEIFRQMASQEGQALLIKFNKWLSKHDRDGNPDVQGTGRIRAGVGIYYFEEPHAGLAQRKG